MRARRHWPSLFDGILVGKTIESSSEWISSIAAESAMMRRTMTMLSAQGLVGIPSGRLAARGCCVGLAEVQWCEEMSMMDHHSDDG